VYRYGEVMPWKRSMESRYSFIRATISYAGLFM